MWALHGMLSPRRATPSHQEHSVAYIATAIEKHDTFIFRIEGFAPLKHLLEREAMHIGARLLYLATAQLLPMLSPLSAFANDLGFARWYHLVADICINEMIQKRGARRDEQAPRLSRRSAMPKSNLRSLPNYVSFQSTPIAPTSTSTERFHWRRDLRFLSCCGRIVPTSRTANQGGDD
jgi:hypothetical protein